MNDNFINIANYDVLIVGCGLTGSVIARHFAEQRHKKVLVVEKRDHIGGNMYDYIDKNGVRVHQYGPHVFHTNNEELMQYMQNYSDWNDFAITCQVNMKGKVTPSPFNYKTIDDYFSKEYADRLKSEIEREYPGQDKATIVELLQSQNSLIREYANFLYESDYSLYTAKQWGISPEEIDVSVLKRVPVLFSYKDGYFDDVYQKVPTDGYVSFFEKLLDNPNIEYCLGIDAKHYLKIDGDNIYWNSVKLEIPVIYTGAIDNLLDYKFGRLPYRSLRFVWNTEMKSHYQQAALVAYPEAEGYTRVTEYNFFPNQVQDSEYSSLAYEYPIMCGENQDFEPYYPLLTADSTQLFEKYNDKLKHVKNLYLCGRLAEFKYYNMDQALQSALNMCKNEFEGVN